MELKPTTKVAEALAVAQRSAQSAGHAEITPAHLALALAEQAVRTSYQRMEAGTLTDDQTEDVGRALMQLEETVRDIARNFGIPIEDLNLDLGPVGKLM